MIKNITSGHDKILYYLERYRMYKVLLNEFLRLLYSKDIENLNATEVDCIFEDAKMATREIIKKTDGAPDALFAVEGLSDSDINTRGYRMEVKTFPVKPDELLFPKWVCLKLGDLAKVFNITMIDATELVHDVEMRCHMKLVPGTEQMDYFCYNQKKQEVEISEYQYAIVESKWVELLKYFINIPIFFLEKYDIYVLAFPEKLGYDTRLWNLEVDYREFIEKKYSNYV